ncbi:MAG: hypothetical protein JWL63_2359 [Rhodocyclales bacterium]|nr:hypothetical protein [Rhodocyclales bacterium]
MSPIEIAAAINENLPMLKQGTLRFWGQWFGRPYDNMHQVVHCTSEGNKILLMFNEDETLTVTNPRDVGINKNAFFIQAADRVRWEWFSYGLPKTKSNLYFEEYENLGAHISVATNVDWHTPTYAPSLAEKAVEIL